MQVDVHTTLGICETHLKQCGNHTTGTDIVTCHNPSLGNHLLNSIEGISKVLCILHCRHIVAHLAEALCKSTTAKTLLIEREVDMIETGMLVVDNNW